MDKSKPSTALVRKRSADVALMPPPPEVKKIKRPRKVLDEDSYTDALSHIIARDYFPGLLETETKQEYLDALDSKDDAWISSAGRRLQQVMAPGRPRQNTPAMRASRSYGGDGQTPTTFVGDTPATEASPPLETKPKLDMNMSLSKFQETYTSEDNESFYKLLDKQNQSKAEKYAWLWGGSNKLPSKQMIKQQEVRDRLAQEGRLIDDGFMKKDRLAIKGSDDRPARPDSWRPNARNGLMFKVESVEDDFKSVAQQSAESSRAGPKTIVLENTRVPEPHVPKRPPSPTASSIRDAIAGRPRAKDRDSAVGGGETPRVNGYSFVDDEDDEPELPPRPAPVIDLGPGDANSPFRVQDQGKRESLHERMVDRISKSKKDASRNGMTGKVDATPVPKFPSSPRVTGGLTPAAQRLWSKIGTPNPRTSGGSFGQATPSKPSSRGSLLRSVSRASSTKK